MYENTRCITYFKKKYKETPYRYFIIVTYFPLPPSVISGVAVTEGKKSGDRAPGEFGFNPLKFGQTEATKKDLALKEIRNGRLAMIAAAGLLAQESTIHGVGALL